jgi:predicted negative regulator of RcsB-dependent stress response
LHGRRSCVIFLPSEERSKRKENVVGTTKLTRKQIIGQDPIHVVLVNSIERVRANRRNILLAAVALVVIGTAIFFGLRYLESRDQAAQRLLTRAMDFYHGQIDPAAPDDPMGKGAQPVFRTEEAKYKAASKEFSEVVSKHGSSKLAGIARYYQGICQMHLGQKQEAIRSLESVRDSGRDRTVSHLAKKVLVAIYLESGNKKGAQELLEGMIKDAQCELPRGELKLLLSRALIAQGKREEGLKVLKEARDESARSSFSSQISQELARLEGPGSEAVPPHPTPVRP